MGSPRGSSPAIELHRSRTWAPTSSASLNLKTGTSAITRLIRITCRCSTSVPHAESMPPDRERLRRMALLAAWEISRAAVERPFPRSIMVRFLLAYLFAEAGRPPDRHWVYSSFWNEIGQPLRADRPEDRYWRSTMAETRIKGFVSDLGLPQTPAFWIELEEELRRWRVEEPWPARHLPSGSGAF